MNPQKNDSLASVPAFAYVLYVLAIAWAARNTLLMRRRPGDEFASIDVFAGAQIAIVLLSAAVLLVNRAALKGFTKQAGTSILWLTALYGLFLVSALWSNQPYYTAYRALEALVLVNATFVVVSALGSFERAERWFVFTGCLVVLMSMYVNVKIYGGFSAIASRDLSAWHTNSYSASAAVMLTYVLGEWRKASPHRRRALRWGGAIGLMGIVVGTSSASNIAAICGLLVILAVTGHFRAAVWASLLGGMLLVLMRLLDLSWWDLFSWMFPGKSLEKVEGFSGRKQGWEHALELFLESPAIGRGFAVSGSESTAAKALPHSSIVGVLAGTGIAGLTLVALFLTRLFGECSRAVARGRVGAVGLSAGLATGLVNSLSMPIILDQWEESSIVFVFLASLLVASLRHWNRGSAKAVTAGQRRSLFVE
jgi:hypothetical protein